MRIRISIPAQTLELVDDLGQRLAFYLVSTARNGAGEQNGSFMTPRGRHLIRAKVGEGAPENTVFVRRRPTGELWSPQLAAQFPDRDWILTRILWLSGLEPSFNRGGDVDTMRRYVYLHGSPETVDMGHPGSIGCVRMRNRDIVELFDRVPVYTPVDIVEFSIEDGRWEEFETAARPVRERVFIEEQKVPQEMEWDAADATARHAVARGPDGLAIGTGRLLWEDHASGTGRIGRMAVLPEWRNRGVGGALFERLLQLAVAEGMQKLELHAQLSAASLYARYGFTTCSDAFAEAGIPHVIMTRDCAAA